jgi:PHD/YefM family antitoxin component YafN of YafNO toxin-antitoxin module
MPLTLTSAQIGISSMRSTYSIAQGQNDFPRLIRMAEKNGMAVVTRHDRAVAYVLSREKMESMIETMELLGNQKFMRILRQHQAGKLKFEPVSVLDD